VEVIGPGDGRLEQFVVMPVHLGIGGQDHHLVAGIDAASMLSGEVAQAGRDLRQLLKPGVTMSALPSDAGRSIRVFLSSTFRDMHGEREVLIKHVLPQLRKRCEARGVSFTEVDLRWGITEAQAECGEVLPVCLAEIDRCRPFFIGLLGERYGWVPEKIPAELLERYPWLAGHGGKSVTELEILHGVLNNPGRARFARFYFRDPAYADQAPDGQRAKYVEADAGAREKLARLKATLRRSGVPVRENYANPRDLGEWILEDLVGAIDEAFPPGGASGPLDREAELHEGFARSRTRVYIGREEYFRRLDEHAAGNGPPLMVVGESGQGKSALLTNWVREYRRANPGAFVLPHFVGASADSSDWAAMLRRILGEWKRRFGIEAEVPGGREQLRDAFADWLHLVAGRGRPVLILDALNQLSDREGALDLAWLPAAVPANVRLVVSTLPGRPLEELARRNWPSLDVEPLRLDERERLIADYLGMYTKRLSEDRARRIAECAQTANPLYLRALLEELRVFGVHERLDERIAHYLAASGPVELYQSILERYEQDYDPDGAGLVRDAMTLLWASRRGLAEAELLELLSEGGQPLPQARWSPLFLAAEQSLVTRGGLIGFFHEYLRQAVQGRYLAGQEVKCRAHGRLADYFDARETDERRLDELPWQLEKAGQWERLTSALTDFTFLVAAYRRDHFDVRERWRALETEAGARVVDAYEAAWPESGEVPNDYAACVASLMTAMGNGEIARNIFRILVGHLRQGEDRETLSAALSGYETALADLGQVAELEDALGEHVRICRESRDEFHLQVALGNYANHLVTGGRFQEALPYVAEQEALCRKAEDRGGLQAALLNRANCLLGLGRHEQALPVLDEAELICRGGDHLDWLQAVLGNKADIHLAGGRLDQAELLLIEKEALCRRLGFRRGLTFALHKRGNILEARGDPRAALALHEQEEQVCREIQFPDGLQAALFRQALLHRDLGNPEGMFPKLDECERICREIGARGNLAHVLGARAETLAASGRLDQALAVHRAEEEVCREVGDLDRLQRCLGSQALIHRARHEFARSLELHTEEVEICRKLQDPVSLQTAVGNRALALQSLGRLDEALQCLREQEALCRAHPFPPGVVAALANRARLLAQGLGRPEEALAVAEEAHAFAVRNGLSDLAAQVRRMREGIRTMAQSLQARAPAGAFWKGVGGLCESMIHDNLALFRTAGSPRLAWAEPRLRALISPAALEALIARARETLRTDPQGSVMPVLVGSAPPWVVHVSVFGSEKDADFLAACPGGAYEQLARQMRLMLRMVPGWQEIDAAYWILLLNERQYQASVHLHTVWSHRNMASWATPGEGDAPRQFVSAPVICPLELMKVDATEFTRSLFEGDEDPYGGFTGTPLGK
jgi:tetratricopeptide (TPR) repeat protein